MAKLAAETIATEVVFSQHDGGWYAEIYRTDTGAELFTTEVSATKSSAVAKAEKWLKENTAIHHKQPVSRDPNCPNCSSESAAEYPCPVCGARPAR